MGAGACKCQKDEVEFPDRLAFNDEDENSNPDNERDYKVEIEYPPAY